MYTRDFNAPEARQRRVRRAFAVGDAVRADYERALLLLEQGDLDRGIAADSKSEISGILFYCTLLKQVVFVSEQCFL